MYSCFIVSHGVDPDNTGKTIKGVIRMTETAVKKNRITIPILIIVTVFILIKILTRTGIMSSITPPTVSLWIQTIQYLGLGVLAIYAFRDDFKEAIGEWKAHPVKSLLWVLGTFIAGFIVEILASIPIYMLYPDYESINDNTASSAAAALPAFVGILALGILGPLTEEAFFRFFMVKRLSGKIPAWICIVISSMAFGFMHAKTFTAAELLYYLPTVMQAAVWAFAVYKTRNITMSLIMHLMINLPAVLMLYIGAALG